MTPERAALLKELLEEAMDESCVEGLIIIPAHGWRTHDANVLDIGIVPTALIAAVIPAPEESDR